MAIQRIVGGKVAVGPVLGRGRTSVVHAGTLLAERQDVAVKLTGAGFQPDAALRMRSEHAVRVLDAGPGWIAMERVYGMVLTNADAHGSIARAAELGLQVCEAVAEAHALGIVHGDLGPHRVFLLHGSNTIRVLGFARPSAGGDSRIDVFGVGTVLHTLARGAHPSPPFDATIRRCLAPNPDDRFQTIEELAETLARFAPPHAGAYVARVRRMSATPSGGVMVVSNAPPALDPPRKPGRVLGCLALAVAAAAAALFTFRRPKPAPAQLFASAPPPAPAVSAAPMHVAASPSSAPTMPRPAKPRLRRAR